MKDLKFLLITLLLGMSVSYAQDQSQASAGLDVGSGLNSYSSAPSVLYHEEISLNRLSWLRIGLGIRAWGHYAGRTDLFTQNSPALRDTMEYRAVSANGVSFVVGVSVRVWRIDLGVDTDLAGLAFGSRRSGFYQKTIYTFGTGEASYNQWLPTSPVVFNVLPLVLKKYNGQSELYARLWISKKLGVKVGYLVGRVAYLTQNQNGTKVLLNNSQRRFSDRYGMPYAALTFPLFD